MIKISLMGKADKRILTYPLMRACSIAGRTCVITNDPGYKRLYAGLDNTGVIEGIKIIVLSDMTPECIKENEEKAKQDDIEYFIIVSDFYSPDNIDYRLMICEHNSSFFGESIEDMQEEHENITFATISLSKIKMVLPKGVQLHQLIWRPEFALYLYQVEELRKLLPLKDMNITNCLVDAFAQALNLKPEAFQKLLKRKRYNFTKKSN